MIGIPAELSSHRSRCDSSSVFPYSKKKLQESLQPLTVYQTLLHFIDVHLRPSPPIFLFIFNQPPLIFHIFVRNLQTKGQSIPLFLLSPTPRKQSNFSTAIEALETTQRRLLPDLDEKVDNSANSVN
ncbi:hypothetical protein KSP40_PGU013890 [Platanthera guangdongensis]|uniref:Uncharacterized protein n=1 Tax=Platanthera guangdongensis TaxID=2320717 RepID=A0ABR2MSY1_9ASPA